MGTRHQENLERVFTDLATVPVSFVLVDVMSVASWYKYRFIRPIQRICLSIEAKILKKGLPIDM